MTLTILLILITFILSALVFHANEQTIESKQRRALKRHNKAQARDRKRAESYWRQRGRVIKPRETA